MKYVAHGGNLIDLLVKDTEEKKKLLREAIRVLF
jgi:hypothetical protein